MECVHEHLSNLANLKEYVSLIQLLVGSVFLSSLFSPIESLKENKRKIRKILLEQFQGEIPENYQIKPSFDQERNAKGVSTKVVIVLVMYGCVALFYSVTPKMSSSWFFLISIVIFAFQLLSLIMYGKIICGGKDLVHFHRLTSIFITILCAILFVISIFDCSWLDLCDRENIYLNVLVFVDLILWFFSYLINAFLFFSLRKLCVKFYDIQLEEKLDIISKIRYIVEKINSEVGYNKSYLKRLCIKNLKNKDNYIQYEENGTDKNQLDLQVVENYEKDLEEIIDAAQIKTCSKKLMKKFIMTHIMVDVKHLHIGKDKYNPLYYIDNKVSKLNEIIVKLYEYGIVSLKP